MRYIKRFARSAGLLSAFALTLSACQSGTTTGTTTTVEQAATFEQSPLWRTTYGIDGFWTVAYLAPYWVSFLSQNSGKSWALRTPTNVSPRRGIALAESPTGEKAVGFFAYGGQTNSVIIEFGPGGVKAPIFLGGPLTTSSEALAFSSKTLFAIRSKLGSLQVVTSTALGTNWKVKAQHTNGSASNAYSSSIGFDTSAPTNGVVLLAPTVHDGIISGVLQTQDSGHTWNTTSALSAGKLSDITATFVPSSFGAKKYEFVFSGRYHNGYLTYVETPAGISNAVSTVNSAVIGADSSGDIGVISNTLGQSPTIAWLAAGSLTFGAPLTMSGLSGAIESVTFKSGQIGIAIANMTGKLVSFSTADGGSSWLRQGNVSPINQNG